MRFLQMEACAHFGMGIDDFVRRPVARQAEMIAHLLIKSVREEYTIEGQKRLEEKKKRKGSGFDPMEAQRRAWRLPGG